MSKDIRRITLGNIAANLATDDSGKITPFQLEVGILELQKKAASAPVDPTYLKHLVAVYESMASLQLMLLALLPKDEARITDAVERMSIRCTALIERTAKLNDVSGPKQALLSEKVRDQLNERGIEPNEETQARDGREISGK